MSLPVRLYDLNKDEDGYGYYYRDENGDKVNMSTYAHWYEGKNYHLIWENMADYCKVVPAIYGSEGEDGVYERVYDEELAEKIFMSYHEEVSRPLQTDGPVWYYENNPPVMKGFSDGLTSADITMMTMGQNVSKRDKMDFSEMKTEIKFCPNCGTKRINQLKFCTECGARLGK